MSEDAIIEVEGLDAAYGLAQILFDLSLSVARGEIVALMGRNGAGKTTFFNVITGLYTPDSGSFELEGKPYAPTEVHLVAQVGIARTFQNIRLFAEMTALENVMVGRHVRTGIRQSMPSNNMPSCAGVSTMLPSAGEGQTKRPFSNRFANRHRPWPSHHKALSR